MSGVQRWRCELARGESGVARPRATAGARRFGAWSVLFGLCGAGCERDAASPRYEAVSGVVAAWSADAGELTIRTENESGGRFDRVCIVTKDTEVYVNDRLAGPDAIAAGDSVSVMGYQNAAARDDRLVVSTARLERAGPAPRIPEFLTAAGTEPDRAGARQP